MDFNDALFKIIRDTLDCSFKDAEKTEHAKGDPLYMRLKIDLEGVEEQAVCLRGVVTWANEHRPWTSFKLTVETRIEPWSRKGMSGESWHTDIGMAFEGWGVVKTVEPEKILVG